MEAVMAEVVSQHVRLFEHLRPFLRHDLTEVVGFPNPVAGQILNWFDPANKEYLDHVDAWQKLLCRNVAVHAPPFVSLTANDELDMSDWEVRAVQQVAKLVYKWHGDPAKKTDWSEVAQRLSKPLPIRLTDDEVSGIRQCLSGIEPVDLNQAIGRFGPGATCEGFDALHKWRRKGLIPDVPPALYRCSPRDNWVPEGSNVFRYTRMAEVPKSIKSNRTVSSEPAMSMFAQLAVNDDLVDQIHRLFMGHVSLHDQERHNALLRVHGMATLDLSDASDHNSCELVERVLPQLWPVLAKVRSEFSILPDGQVIKLATFAPMGSGVCFSVMTTVILGIIAYAFRSLGFRWYREMWSVYGDDIIVPIWIADYVIDLLERAGFVINIGKSCTSGVYVESCGLELRHNFYDVTPCYLKDDLSTLEASKVEQIARKMCEQYPSTLKEILRLSAPVKGQRWNKDLQCTELLVRTRAARSKLAVLDGYAGLNRWFSVHTQQEYAWNRHLAETDSRPPGVEQEVWTKIAWRYRSAINYPLLSLWLASRA
jgi:hypothetical protein